MSPEPVAPLLLVRHGQSEWNALRRWQGQADSPLSDAGRQHAAAVAAAVAATGIRFAQVWSSDLGRARATAQALAEAVGDGTVRVDARLREADAGPWEGLTPDEIERRWPGWLARGRRPDGFEPGDRLVARALAACADLLAAADRAGSVLAVTHSGLIRTLRRHLGVVDDRIPNLGGTWLRAGAGGRPEVVATFEAPIDEPGRPSRPVPTVD